MNKRQRIEYNLLNAEFEKALKKPSSPGIFSSIAICAGNLRVGEGRAMYDGKRWKSSPKMDSCYSSALFKLQEKAWEMHTYLDKNRIDKLIQK